MKLAQLADDGIPARPVNGVMPARRSAFPLQGIALVLSLTLVACDAQKPPQSTGSTAPSASTAGASANVVPGVTESPIGSRGPVDSELAAAGLPPELAGTFGQVTTRLVTNDPGHSRIRQELPATHQIRDTEIRVTAVHLDVPPDAMTLLTDSGIQVHPVLLQLEWLPRGYILRTSFYFPPGELSPEEYQGLAPVQPITAGGEISSDAGIAAGPVADGESGVLEDTAVRVADASADVGETDTLLKPPQGTDGIAQDKLGTWDNIDAMDSVYKDPANPTPEEILRNADESGQWIRDQDFANRGISWKENELRIAEETADAARFNGLVASGLMLWQAYKGIRDWWRTDDELKALSDCNNDTTNPLHRDQSDIDATNQRISDVRNELRINNAIRGANTGLTYLAGKLPGPAGLAALALTSAGDSMLAEDASHITSGLSGSVAPCKPKFIKVSVAYRFSGSHDEHPVNDSSGQVNDVFDAVVIVPLAGSQIKEVGRYGQYRHGETGKNDCASFSNSMIGPAAAYVTGEQDGFITSTDPKVPPTPTFHLAISIVGKDLLVSNVFSGCTAGPPESRQDGTATLTCDVTKVDVVHGGLYKDPNGTSSSGATSTVSQTCRVIVEPLLAAPAPGLAEQDPPPPYHS